MRERKKERGKKGGKKGGKKKNEGRKEKKAIISYAVTGPFPSIPVCVTSHCQYSLSI